jgi:integrase
MAAGVRQRHSRTCSQTARCKCPYEAFVYSKRDGKKIRKTFATHAAAVAWRNEAATAVKKKLMRAPSTVTVGQAAEQWLTDARAGVVRTRSGDAYKPSALRTYDAALRLRVLPELRFTRLSEVSRIDLQDLVDRLVADGLAASTVVVALLPLRAMFRRTMARGEIAVNPTTGLTMPAIRGGRDRIASPSECDELLEALAVADRALWATAMYGGLRRGELMALRVEDVDLGAGVIHVRRGWDAHEGEIETKSRQARKVPIALVLRDYLDEHLMGLGYADGLVFGATTVLPFAPNQVTGRADTAWKKAELNRITLHECRHTFASLMIAAGVNAKALSTYMGHANISITLDRYGHLMPGNEDQAAALLDAYLTRETSMTGADTGAQAVLG